MGKIKKIKFYGEQVIEATVEWLEFGKYEQHFIVRIPEEYDLLIEEYKERGQAQDRYHRGKSIKFLNGESINDVEVLFQKYYKEFFQRKTVVDKIIIYTFQYRSPARDSTDKSGFVTGRDDQGVELSFQHKVVNKSRFGKSIRLMDIDNGRRIDEEISADLHGYNNWVEIPYTPEAEAFFIEIRNALDILSDKIMKFIGNKKDILKSIKSKQLLLK